jgi:energy-coupling factor transporter ATP-binding protein EcfA2
MKRSLIIQGPQGSGKSTLAKTIADMVGPKTETVGALGFNKWLSEALCKLPDTLIVEEFDPTNSEQMLIAKSLIANDKITIGTKESIRTVPTPNFIFVSGSANPIKPEFAGRRFFIVDVA